MAKISNWTNKNPQPFVGWGMNLGSHTRCSAYRRYDGCSYRCYNLYNKLKCFSLCHG